MCKTTSKGSDSVRNKTYKKVTAYLVLQCILLLEAIILLSIEHKTKADIYENGEENFANQKNTLREEIENLETKKDGLQQENNNANKQKQQLKEEEKALLKHLHGMDGWMCYQSVFYYMSTETKNWTESKKDCEQRGASLMIINSKEEHKFFKSDANVWIGLTDKNEERKWKWVDGSELATGFSSWGPGEPNGLQGESCAASFSAELYDFSCSETFNWICERK
ncbi:C-type lectin domain family 17, member A-like [Danio rerio]|uniref:C-type lectin domain family 17, member A-like n=1 Tax=Danio rerio TaxID=7955 RepID=A0A8M9PSS5_DANRE|nr:asialoglycoprotein receptor 1-like [Danio rerio]|eukprot:XP_021327944.1 asialoglycoprotein receptor 1-like [Danio rerio]